MLFPDFRSSLKTLSGVLRPQGDIVTLTLNLAQSGRLPPETKQFFTHKVLKSLRQGSSGHEQRRGLRRIADRIEDYVFHTIRPETEGLFLTAGPDLWESFELPLPMRNFFWAGSSPYVAPLLDLEERAPRSLIVIADRSTVRLEEMYLGFRAQLAEVTLRSEGQDPQRTVNLKGTLVRPSGGRFSRRSDATNQKRTRRQDEKVAEIFREAARTIASSWRRLRPTALLFFGERWILPDLAKYLPEEIASEAQNLGSAPVADHEMAATALQFLARQAEERRAQETRRLLKLRTAGRLVSLGPSLALARLSDGTAERFYLDPYDPLPGCACTNCGTRYSDNRRTCGYCNQPTRPVSLTQEIVAARLSRPGMDVTFVTKPAKWLVDLGGMVAIRRPLNVG